MALGERAARHRPPVLEQSGKAEQKTQDDGAENVSAGRMLPAHLQPRNNLCGGVAVQPPGFMGVTVAVWWNSQLVAALLS